MTSPESREIRETVKMEGTGEGTPASGLEKEKRFSGLQRKRVLELISRFDLRRVEDIATAMRISSSEAEKLCSDNLHEEENNG